MCGGESHTYPTNSLRQANGYRKDVHQYEIMVAHSSFENQVATINEEPYKLVLNKFLLLGAQSRLEHSV